MKLLLISILFLSTQCFAQLGSVKGVVTDSKTNDPMPFVKVILYKDSTVIGGASTDFDGKYLIKAIQPGVYDLLATNKAEGYSDTMISGITVSADKITIQDFTMVQNVELQSIQEVAVYSVKKKDISRRAARSSRRYYANGYANARDFNREEYSHIKDNDYIAVKKDPLSTFSIDVDRASYSNVRRMINDGSLPPADAVRVEEMINYFAYDYPKPTDGNPFSISSEYTDCPWNKEHKLVQIGIKGQEIEMSQASPNNLVFLIDVSGSMNSPDKLDLLKKGLYLLVDQLRDEDKVAIVVYAGASGLTLPSTSGDQKDQIRSVIEQLNAGGSTAGGAGIELAYKVATQNFQERGNNRVILATDGDFNVGISSEGELVRLIEKKRESGVFLSVLGFGTGNIQDNKMEQLADKGNGNYNYIDNILEAKKVLVSELGGTLITIAKDVKVQVEFNPKHVKAYRQIGYVNRQLEDEDFNDDTKDAGELGSGHSVTALYEIIPAGSKEKIRDVDSLKYQKEEDKEPVTEYGDEVLTVKFRYKEPKGTKSKLIEDVLLDNKVSINDASDNCRFAAAVAEYAMLLRDSEFKGKADYDQVLELARSAKGADVEGYRAEFIRLVEMTELLAN